MAYEGRTYHGIQQGPESEGEWHPARILVEEPDFGPTERQYGVTVLRELAEPEHGGFGWGYNGGGTSAAAAAILADALDSGDPDKCGIGCASYPEDQVLADLREDFCDEALSQFYDRWRLRRSVILRWARTWYLQRGIGELPAALRELPPLQSRT
ncbi:DUF6166 domain-containing protein [Streptomyces sp. NPDC056361]|uniref:DUF6166 domain-containing protein n=1 Tax=Streptomyces sp. NPDC056361 TaxID=3345795 RepID=UPI0035DA94B2